MALCQRAVLGRIVICDEHLVDTPVSEVMQHVMVLGRGACRPQHL